MPKQNEEKIELLTAGLNRIPVTMLKLEQGAIGAYKCPTCPRVHLVMDPMQMTTASNGRRVTGVALTPEEAESLADQILTAGGFTPIKVSVSPERH